MDWLPVWGPSVAAVIVAAAFTWLFGILNERQHRQGIRTLVSQEFWHNMSSVMVLRGHLQMLEDAGEPRLVVQTLGNKQSPLPWQHVRWDLPEVGVALSREELSRYTEWYVTLDHLTYLYDALVNDVVKTPMNGAPPEVPEPTATTLMDFLREVVAFADAMIANAPPLLDPKLLSDPGMQKYTQELIARQAERQKRGA